MLLEEGENKKKSDVLMWEVYIKQKEDFTMR